MNPDVLIVHPNIKKAYGRLLRMVVVKRVGNYSLIELDGKYWWERSEKMQGSRGIFPRTEGEYTTWYYPTKAMKKRGYKSTTTYWFKEPKQPR